MEKSKKDILAEEINNLNKEIESARKKKKDIAKLRKKLIELIIELDSIEQDKEFESKTSE